MFKVGDKVKWDYSAGGIWLNRTGTGVIDEINDGCRMEIREPQFKECRVWTGARLINGQWLVHHPYQGYILILEADLPVI